MIGEFAAVGASGLRKWTCRVSLPALLAIACGRAEEQPGEWRLPELPDAVARDFNAPLGDGTCSVGSPHWIERGGVRYTLVLDGGLQSDSRHLSAVVDECGNWLVLYERTESYFAAEPAEGASGNEYPSSRLVKVFPNGLFAWERPVPLAWERPVGKPEGPSAIAHPIRLAVGSPGVAAVMTEVTGSDESGSSSSRQPFELYLADGTGIQATADLGISSVDTVHEDRDSGGWWLQNGDRDRGVLVRGPSFEPRRDDWLIEEEDLGLPMGVERRRLDGIALADGGRAFMGIAPLHERPGYQRVEGEDEAQDVSRLYVRRLVPPDAAGSAHLINLLVQDAPHCTAWGSLAAHDDQLFAAYGCEVYDRELPEEEQFSWWFRVVAFNARKLVWEWEAPGGLRIHRVIALPDGEVLVIGARAAEEGSGGILCLYLLDQTGELSWSRDYGDDPRVPQTWDWSVSHAALTPDGHVLVGATLDGQAAVTGSTRKYWVGEFKWAD